MTKPAPGTAAALHDYVLELDAPHARPVLLSVLGGNISTYRRMAAAAIDRLAPHLRPTAGLAAGWTGTAALPGGDSPGAQIRRGTGPAAGALPIFGACDAAPAAAGLWHACG